MEDEAEVVHQEAEEEDGRLVGQKAAVVEVDEGLEAAVVAVLGVAGPAEAEEVVQEEEEDQEEEVGLEEEEDPEEEEGAGVGDEAVGVAGGGDLFPVLCLKSEYFIREYVAFFIYNDCAALFSVIGASDCNI